MGAGRFSQNGVVTLGRDICLSEAGEHHVFFVKMKISGILEIAEYGSWNVIRIFETMALRCSILKP